MTTTELEDIDLPAPEEDRDEAGAILPPLPLRTLEELWSQRERIGAEVHDLYAKKTRLEQEIERRARAARTDYDPATSKGSIELAGANLVLRVTYSRTYEYDPTLIAQLANFVTSEVLTEPEYAELVKWSPDVNGTVYNRLALRGGVLSEHLAKMRKLKSARPQFEPKERSA